MKAIEQRREAEKFARFWKVTSLKKTENEITQQFWEDLLQHVYGVKYTRDFISFETKVRVPGEPKPKRIDGYIASTKVLIEQKSRGISLDRKIEQSGGIFLTPYEQAKRYADNMINDRRPRWIVVSNFDEFRIHDLNSERADEFQLVRLEDFPKEYHRLGFLQDITSTNVYKEVDVSRKAGKLIGEIYTELMKQYPKMDERLMHELNVLCVRLVFCLYAEDAGIFPKNKFGNYLRCFTPSELQYKIKDLFTALGTKNTENLFIDPKAKEFEYVNGGLFQDTTILVPPITEEVKMLLVKKSSDDFNWEEISPTIFGAMFESTLNPESRREGGMHYTSVENIHKVIAPLFLDDLEKELDSVLKVSTAKLRKQKIREFQEKLAGITCLDPACGSGNFLTETYMSLRRLENVAIQEYYRDMPPLMGGVLNPIRVSINQFHGIEINDFAVSVAKTAMWIAEYQMRMETYSIVRFNDPYLPLRTKANIIHGNALRMDWNDVVPAEELTYIVGNPPFVGSNSKKASDNQKKEIKALYVDEKGKPYHNSGKIDYVSGWYMKSVQMMQLNPKIRAALVSTNSITQGEQVASVWRPLVERYGLRIEFAHRTFKWQSDSYGKAHVHCVIIGFGIGERERMPVLYDGDEKTSVHHINAYLLDMADVWVENRDEPLFDVPLFVRGSQPTDGKHLLLSQEERDGLLAKHPEVSGVVRPFMMGADFLAGKPRYCLWLNNVSPSLYKKCGFVMDRIKKVEEYRLTSPKKATQKKATTPHLFDEIKEPKSDYVALPIVSSENREYIPIACLDKSIVPGNKLFFMEGSSLYHFGIITSVVHMAWMRMTCGRLEMRYSYSNTIVYNNYPWPKVTKEQEKEIESLAQAILDVRASLSEYTLADMYDPKFMPPALRKAHKTLDRAVMKLYGLKPDTEETDIVQHLLGLYKVLSEVGEKKPKRGK